MARQKFDRYMLALGVGTHPKLAHLTDGEWRAHVGGVLAVAARSPERGALLVGDMRAEPIHIAVAAGVPEKVAASAMGKLESIGILERDDDLGCLRVHDWEDVNPPPKSDPTRNARQKRLRDRRNAPRNGGDNAKSNAPHNAPSNAKVTPAEVEVEVEAFNSHVAPAEIDRGRTVRRERRVAVFDEWVKATGRTKETVLDEKRGKVIDRALSMGVPFDDVLDAVRGVRRSDHHMGNRQWSELRVVLRDVAQIEHFRDLERQQRGSGSMLSFVDALNARNGAA